MAQTTGALSGGEFKLEISTDGGSNFTDISGSVTSVTPSGAELASGETYTGDGDDAITTFGKRGPLTLNVVAVYGETAGEAYQAARTAVEAAERDVQLRWSPAGGAVGDEQFTSPDGALVSPMLPAVDAAGAGPLAISFQWKGPGNVTAAVVT